MRRLVKLLCDGPVKNSKRRCWEHKLHDKRTKQTLVIEKEDKDFSVYDLDSDWDGRTKTGPSGDVKEKSVDGLLIAKFTYITAVCFIDLKGKMATAEQQTHAVEQFKASAAHFAPFYRAGDTTSQSHGDDHHDAWSGPSPDEAL